MPSSKTAPIGLIGNFSGDAPQEIADRSWIQLDRDTLDDAIRASNATALLELPFCHSLRISAFEHFHPDQIVERVPALKALLYARAEIANPAAMRSHLEEAGASVDMGEPTTVPPSGSPNDDAAISGEAPADDDLLDSILGGSAAPVSAPRKARSAFDQMVAVIVEESGASGDFAREDARQAAIDQELTRRIRAIVQHPRFRALEASWIAARRVVRAGDETSIFLFDLRLGDVVVEAERPTAEQQLPARIARSASSDGSRREFSFLLAAIAITDDPDGTLVCSYLSQLASETGAPLVLDIDSNVLRGDRVPDEMWISTLKNRSIGRVALAYPPTLQRLPYGETTDPIDEFPFEEFAEDSDDFKHVWGSAALSMGASLARSIEVGGPFGEISDLPIHVYRENGEPRSVGPVAELLHESRIKDLNDTGITCLVGFVGGDSAHVVGLRSLQGERLIDT